ncbi:MAG: head GIN domain-containing protein [Bacteroidota bacterium]
MKRFFIAILVVPVLLASCHYFHHNRIRGNGSIKTETRTTGTFSSIDVGGNIEVYLKQDSIRSVRVEADENLMQYILVRTDGDELVVEPKDGYNLSGSKDIKVYISSPFFKKLHASGASGITGETQLTGERIDIEVSGASNARLDIKTPKVSAEISGASSVVLKGQTKDLSVEVDGASHAKCFELLSENADIDVSGASSAEVFASVNLKADASGASHIRYKGAATKVGDASGAGSIKKVE